MRLVLPSVLTVLAPARRRKNGDTHITGQGVVQTLDCNNATLFVNGTGNTINAKGTCWGCGAAGGRRTS